MQIPPGSCDGLVPKRIAHRGQIGASPQRGGASSSAFIATAANASLDDLARAFSHIFAVAVVFLIIGVVALMIMEERPLRTTVLAVPATRETPPRAPAE